MSALRRFRAMDLFRFNSVNLDRFTETYDLSFYLSYLSQWPDLFTLAESADGRMMAYLMGKVEGEGADWHGHVTALTVAPECRRLGLARGLMSGLEDASEKTHDCYFVDLFVRPSNAAAVRLYEELGYIVYRQVLEYYIGDGVMPTENAYDMRKAMPRDTHRRSVVPLERPITVEELLGG
ncbi:N(alpha)-acetyltransferase 20, NatB catalytic subunit [Coemansia javaensis]|uniref:N(Alpha)-acetyltransferase 20, NatB catalytic subunit n=1 Tax=Coemansia javaensis TaxID=2761396 RepID=A0A9W8H1J2_9FUNG|nr:N(alpha)-acetyltransferase 20, NatB catalytic subunit [Coemansia javaensis]